MSPLLEALQAAQEVGFDAPKCGRCDGVGSHSGLSEEVTCSACDGEWCAVHTPKGQDCECDFHGRHIGYDCPDIKDGPCTHCHATGLDASDPFGLIGRAVVWLKARSAQIQIGFFQWGDGRGTHAVNAAFRPPAKPVDLEEHEDTPIDLATAMLRLVAQVGGAS